MATEDVELQKIEEQFIKLKKKEMELKRKKASKEKENQKRREAIIGQMIFEKASKGSPEHQAVLINYIDSLKNPRHKELFEGIARALGLAVEEPENETINSELPSDIEKEIEVEVDDKSQLDLTEDYLTYQK